MRFLAITFALTLAAFAENQKPRLIVLTDIGGDPDDQQSMVRLLTYANEFEIEGLIASASGTPGELKRDVVQPDLIREMVNAYGEVQPNLIRHASEFPSAKGLLSKIKSGNQFRGVEAIGEAKDTEGSRWIISVVDKSDPRPVNITVWGGPTELAQALWRVKKDRSEAEVRKFISRIRVHAIGHQDNSGPWILQNFPDLFYILSAVDTNDVLGRSPKGTDRRASVYRGMYLGGDESLTSREWIDTNVRNNHGPLGALYPPKTWTAPNPHSALKEGDSPSWLHFLPIGLSNPEKPEWGSWGGRFRRVERQYYNDAKDTVNGVTDGRATVWRWRPAFQNDFQARMDWCIKDRSEANHNPEVVLNGDKSKNVVEIDAKPGAKIRLNAAGTRDPDGHKLSYRWFVYPEAGSPLDIKEANRQTMELDLPRVEGRRSVHIILEVVDSGTPALFGYRRAIVNVQ